MKSAVLFSGGKDSVMALNYAINNGDDVKYLLSIKSQNDESYMFHVPNIHLTDLQAEAIGIPIIEIKTAGVKEEELEDLKEGFKKLKSLGIEAIYTGALFSTYQKSRIERLADEIGIEAISPYWHKDPKEYMDLVIDSGFKVIISGVFAYGLDEGLMNHGSADSLTRIHWQNWKRSVKKHIYILLLKVEKLKH